MSAIEFRMCRQCGRHSCFYDTDTGERIGGHSFSKSAALHALQGIFDEKRISWPRFLELQHEVYLSPLPGDEPPGMVELFVADAQYNKSLGIVLESEEEVLDDLHEMLKLFPDQPHPGVTWQ